MLKFRNLQIQHKLIASFAAVLMVVLVLAAFNYAANSRICSLSKSLEENAYLAYKDGISMTDDFSLLSESLTEAVAFSDTGKLGKANDIAKRLSSTLSHAQKVSPENAKELGEIDAKYNNYLGAGRSIVTGDQSKATSEANLQTFGTVGNEVREMLQKFTKSKDALLQSGLVEVTSTASFYKNFTTGISISTILIAGILAFMLGRSIGRPLTKITEIAERVAVGDLTVDIQVEKRHDEVGRLYESFHALIEYIRGLSLAIEGISRNDLSVKIEPKSSQDALSMNIKRSIQMLQDLAEETRNMTRFAMEGKLSQRGNDAKFQGVYADVVKGMNTTFEAVVQPFNETAAALEQLAAHDLTVRVRGDYQGDFDRIKQAMNTASENLCQALGQVAGASHQITGVSGQISESSQALSESATSQASSLEEISSSLQEMAAMTKQNAANAKEARSQSEGARNTVARGMESMKRLSDAINRIKASSDSTAKIVKTIDEIAFQTNLLALNAAVEAARAGDAGKGFAVVAEEVRNLAMRSAEAAKNTSNLIEESVSNAEQGVSINQEVLTNLREINAQVDKVSEVMAEIASASDQQSQGIGQITDGVDQVNHMTQRNAANSEESASSAVELDNLAHKMQKMVNTFELGEHAASQEVVRHAKMAEPKLERKSVAARKDRAKEWKSPVHEAAAKMIPLDGDLGTLQEF